MFEYYQNILCVEAGWLYGNGNVMSKTNYNYHKSKETIKVLRRGCKGTPALVEYNSLPERFRNLIVDNYGDPHKTTKHTTFKDLIRNDSNIYEYFHEEYKLSNGSQLPEKTKREYYANAIILNACHGLSIDNRSRRKALGGRSSTKLWDRLAAIIQDLPKHTYPHSLPKNPRSLKKKYRAYIEEGCPALVHKNFANKNSEKINDDAKVWVISRWADRLHKCATIEQLYHEYNKEAKIQDWKKLKDKKTLHIFLNSEEIKHLWWGHRYGDASSKNKYKYRHSTLLPSFRDSLWYSDGTKMNLYYLNEEGKMETCQVYEVMDAYSDVLLGYHVSKSENFEAQFMAYKMAIQTSEHKPYQISFDGQGGHKKLETGDFFSKLSRISIKTEPYNGSSKTIENAFKRFQESVMAKYWFFTGQNITTKKMESKANTEFILANKDKLPTLDEAIKKYAEMRQEWNESAHHTTKVPRLEMYMSSENPEAVKVGVWDMVDMFWIMREKPVIFSMYGLQFQEKNEKYNYIKYSDDGLPDVEWMRENVDKKFYVKFDPSDMSMIYLYDKTPLGLRFVTQMTTKIEIHRGKQEQEDWESHYIKAVADKNNEVRQKINDAMDDILEEHGALPEQHGFKSPALLGTKSKRKKTQNSIGKVMKKETNLVDIEEEDTNYYNEY